MEFTHVKPGVVECSYANNATRFICVVFVWDEKGKFWHHKQILAGIKKEYERQNLYKVRRFFTPKSYKQQRENFSSPKRFPKFVVLFFSF